MHPRVTPSEARLQETILPNYIQEEHEMPSSFVSNKAVVEVFTVASRNTHHGEEEMLKACEEIYSPILKSMKLFGIYFGETSLKKVSSFAPPANRRVYVSKLYCFVGTTILWLNFAMAFISAFMEGTSTHLTFFTLLTIGTWSLKTALSGTICSLVLPLTDAKISRFESFIRKLAQSNTDLKDLRYSSKKVLIASAVFWITSTLSNVVIFLFLPWAVVGNHKPWKEWYGLNSFSLISTLFVAGAWLLPVAFVCVTCLVLAHLFDEFCKRALSSGINGLDVAALKDEHRKLCTIAELASRMLSPLLLVTVALFLPLTCFTFYITVNPSAQMSDAGDEVSFLLGTIYWLIISAGTVAVILVFGSRVNEKVSGDNAIKTYNFNSR